MKKFKAIMEEKCIEVASLQISSNVELDMEVFNTWLQEQTHGDITAVVKDNIICCISKNNRYRVIVGTCDDGTRRFHVFRVQEKMKIQEI